jgi:hypothetical protein
MTIRSPWQHKLFVGGVAIWRRLLRPFGGAENAFIRRLVTAHNRRIEQLIRGRAISSLLLIVPRCLKQKGCRCDVRPTGAVADGRRELAGQPLAECHDCEQCPLGEVARLTQRYGLRTFVAFRSHIAYAMARRQQPDLIIATACEDRLIKALRSVPEIPALLTPLTSMERPCVNANCDLGWIAEQVRRLVSEPESAMAEPSSSSRTREPSPSRKRIRSAEGL